MIDGIAIDIDDDAVIVRANEPLTVVSSAAVGGGFARARSIVNLHVDKDFPVEDLDRRLSAFARGRELWEPWVGLFTAAFTARARIGEEAAAGISGFAVATVGLSNLVSAGVSPLTSAAPSTINTIVVVDAAPTIEAMVNLVMTVTEVKTLVVAEAGVRCTDGSIASGTSTDAVVVAATGRGRQCRFGGPVSDLGWVVASAARSALEAGVKHRLGDRR